MFRRTLVLGAVLPLILAGSASSPAADSTTRDLLAWGRGSQGQLGDGADTREYYRTKPGEALAQIDAVSVSAGFNHSVALDRQGMVWAWGDDSLGQLGDTKTQDQNAPLRVTYISGVQKIAAGWNHTLALKSDGTVWAWGHGVSGQLGNATKASALVPSEVFGLTGVTAIAAGADHSLALRSDGTVWAWGKGSMGQRGDGSLHDSDIPLLSTISNVVAIAAGANHSLAVKSDGTVWTWGQGNAGQLGNGGTTSSSLPVQATGLTTIMAVAGGLNHSLALAADGTVWSWGSNSQNQLGVGGSTRTTPARVSLSGVAIAAGSYHSLAIDQDGTVWAWGWNSSGQLGTGVCASCGTLPAMVPGVGSATAISGGDGHSLASGLLPSGECYGGTQVIDGSVSSAQERIYVQVIDENNIWICFRLVSPRGYVASDTYYVAGQPVRVQADAAPSIGGKLVYSGVRIPDLSPFIGTSDSCTQWVLDHSSLGQRVSLKIRSDPPTVCIFGNGSWTSLKFDAGSIDGLLVDIQLDP